MKIDNFFAELKRRNVYKVAVAYAVVAWLTIQGASIFLPAFNAPQWAMQIVILVLVIGFPIALVLSWAFEITPEGIKLESEIEPNKSVTRQTGRKLAAFTVVLAVIAAGMFVFQFVRSRSSAPASAPMPTITNKSIAVLPFESLSDDKANGYFASGIQDEILTRLAKIGALKVISRSSTQQYQSKPGNLRDVGQQLGVANILEGSVQKASDQVHINVQLIRAATDDHLWAESYNRKLDDIFGVEGEVAGAIAEALNARLTGAEEKALAARPTNNPTAYDAYLRGLNAENQTFGPEQLATASKYYAEAVRLDPNFALAWAHGSIVDGLIYLQAIDHTTERLAATLRGADMAMRLAPESTEAWLAKGYYLYRIRNYDGALAALEEAGKRSANNPEVIAARAFVERRRGNYQKSNELIERSLERDPRNLANLTTIGETLIAMGRPAEARRWIDRALAISPDDGSIVAMKANSYLTEGDLDAAGRLLERLPAQLDNVSGLGYQIDYRNDRRDYAWIVTALRSLFDSSGFQLTGYYGPFLPQLAWAQRHAGNEAAAEQTFKESREKLEALREKSGDNGYIVGALAQIEAGLGNFDVALREAEQSVSAAGEDHYIRAGQQSALAVTQALCGRKDEALTTLSLLAKEPVTFVGLGSLRYAPEWDGLRKDPRFQSLVAQAEAAMKAQGVP
ncbi:MAG: tetratricopeptide repeat protein [Chthoniobacterales bacterium]